jgi:hypothetical protein
MPLDPMVSMRTTTAFMTATGCLELTQNENMKKTHMLARMSNYTGFMNREKMRLSMLGSHL